MAAHTVTTTANIDSFTPSNGDTFTVNLGGKLQIDQTSTEVNIAGLTSILGGEIEITSTNTTNPLLVVLGDTAGMTIQNEGDSKFTVSGDWVSLGTSDGSASQTFTLPTSIDGTNLPLPPFVVVDNGGTETLYTCINAHHSHAATLSDVYGAAKMGKFFYYNSASNRIEFGDGTNGYIPENLATIKIPNIFIMANSQVVTMDFNIGGKLDVSKACFTQTGTGGYYSMAAGFTSCLQFKLVDAAMVSTATDLGLSTARGEITVTRSSIALDHGSAMNMASPNGSPAFTDSVIYHVDNGSSANEQLILLTNADSPSFTGCKLLSRYEVFETQGVSDMTISDCILAGSGTNLNLIDFNSTTGCTIQCEMTGYPFTDVSATAVRMFFLSNGSSSNSFDLTTINDHEASFSNGSSILMLVSAGCNNNTINSNRGTIDLGANGASQLIWAYGAGTILKGIKIEGDFSGKYIDLTSSTANCTFEDVRLESHSVSTRDFEFATGSEYKLVSTQDSFDINFNVNAAQDCCFHSIYERADLTRATIYCRMSEPLSGTYFTQTNGTGGYQFADDVRFYMETVGDKFQFESSTYKGITGIEADAETITALNGSNFTVRFKMKVPDIGSYGSQYTFTQANLATAFAALTESADEIKNRGIVIAYEIEKTAGTFYDSYIRDLRFVATIEADFAPIDYIDVPFSNLPNTATDIVRVEELDSGGLPLSPNVYVDVTGSGGTATANLKKNTKYRYKADAIGYYRSDAWVNFDTTTITAVIVQLREIVDSDGNSRYGNGDANVKALLAYDSASDEMRITYDASYPDIDYDSALDKTEEILTSFAALDADLQQPAYEDGQIIFTASSTVDLADAPGNTGRPNLQFATYRAGQANSNNLLKNPFHTTYGLNTKDTNVNITDLGNIKSVQGTDVTDIEDFKNTTAIATLQTSVDAIPTSVPNTTEIKDAIFDEIV